MATLLELKYTKKVPVWKSVGESYAFLFGNLQRFAAYAVALAVLLQVFEYLLLRTETGTRIYLFLTVWMFDVPGWIVGESAYWSYLIFAGGLEAISFSPLFGRSFINNWTPVVLAEAAFAALWIRMFLRANRGEPWPAKPLALEVGKVFAVLWLFHGLKGYAAIGEYWLIFKASELMVTHDTVFFLVVSVLVVPPIVAFFLYRIPLAVPGIVAGEKRFGVGAIRMASLGGMVRLLVALLLASIPFAAVDWLLVKAAGFSYDSRSLTGSEVLNTLIEFGQQLANFTYIAVFCGVYAMAWYVQADAAQSTGLSAPSERVPQTGTPA